MLLLLMMCDESVLILSTFEKDQQLATSLIFLICEKFLEMAKKTLTGPGLEPESSRLTCTAPALSHVSYPALW